MVSIGSDTRSCAPSSAHQVPHDLLPPMSSATASNGFSLTFLLLPTASNLPDGVKLQRSTVGQSLAVRSVVTVPHS
eukprot:scaffold2635_cov47-Cyclotella_meneghiniana.AAC.7